ncbi:MAG: 4-hydroxy-tetrahydrodipicolinate reductase [Clostridia bacterium]
MKILIGGALGRMGRELAQCAQAADIAVACGVDVAYRGQAMDFPMVTGFDLAPAQADVLVDFSRADALPELLQMALQTKMPAVLCATGYTDAELLRIKEASAHIAILRSANMSLGVSVLRALVAMAAKALGEDFDIEIVEKHHRMKQDSPSGTALMLLEAAQAARSDDTTPVYGRYGRNEKREPHDIGLHAIRGGTVTGEHEVGFYGNGEQLLLTHRAENRALFAQGALKAACFLAGKPAGLYSMQDVVSEIMGQ